MLLLRVSAMDLVTHILEQNVQITNQFGTVNLVVWPDLCQTYPNQSDGEEDPPAHIRIRG